MRKALSLVCALALGFTGAMITRPAGAQAMGNKGDMALSAERLMGIYFYDEGVSSTHIGLGIAPIAPSAYHLPRLGFDYFVIDNLSVGGSFGFGLYDPNGPGSSSGALIAARVGYALEFSKVFGFWPRGGFGYKNFGNNSEEFAFTLEALFYAAPIEHFAITFGPLMDLGIAGSGTEARNFALVSAGVLGWF